MVLVQESEAELIERAKAGDRGAQAAIVRKYEQMVYNVALRLTGNVEEAEGVMQETFIKVLEALPSFRGDAQLGTWIYRIATNFALMQLRKRRTPVYSLEEYNLDESRDLAAFNRSLAESPEAMVLNAELRRVMEEAIEALPPKYKTAFVLKDMEGLSLQQIAEMLELNVATVKTHIHRARLFLRDRLAEYVERGKK
ncbi:MAG: sigma-70 family RNA polymerase sigma factor [candidate division KSB1 bacterium]|nr:sigma-70 family RNA polymerase sigma factor [candidate division KSB1 bacterium]MDZ7337439.1 sigma-70 family RNA polymerase sigma factor [candidate division KSB1 bacterium]MDZ7385512.1 sigma-70 family RNA polymerase sigma factor [candidate division KSB1 bacterium]MDZ7393303.1 sigma-70 family RNA polymerase sigma factor [candidate division KSB1 bacterium]MDZ7413161.1 sigma-70 family RNA polymerase sigma factor [candidate division KSB1 bacterium]